MGKSYGVVVVVLGGGPGHFTVSTGTGGSFYSLFPILFPGPRSQVPGQKSQSQSLDNKETVLTTCAGTKNDALDPSSQKLLFVSLTYPSSVLTGA